uniref:Uncharacterized protein n=1 Tax=Leersia perrieri TaxID=77586 RepID=A0A0D9XNJ2_9ORYZ
MDPFAGSKYSARDRREAGVPSPSSTSDPPAQRHVKRFADLTPDETCDLCITAKDVGVRLEQYHKASSLTFTIQVTDLTLAKQFHMFTFTSFPEGRKILRTMMTIMACGGR